MCHQLQAVKQADSWLPAEGHAKTKHQAQLEAHTSLAGALHASGNQEGAHLQCQTALSLARHDTSELPLSSVTAALKQTAAMCFAQVGYLLPCLMQPLWYHMLCCAVLCCAVLCILSASLK